MAKKKTNDKQAHHDGEHSQLPAPKGILIAIGGKENKGEAPEIDSSLENNENFEQYSILRRFVDELWGEEPLILIIPTASGEPGMAARDYITVFRHLKYNNIEVADIRTRADTMKAENLELLKKAGGVIFTGGDQLKLTAIFGGTEFLDILKDKYTKNRFVIAGTSAGATALSTPMIFEGGGKNSGFLKGQLQITTGLEFLKDVAIDTHFIARGRIVRMAQMVAMNPGAIGIGLEEDTAIVVTEGKDMEVIGSGVVTVVDGHPSTFTNIYEIKDGEPVTVCDLKVHFLSRGQRYCINKRDQTYK
jgi:cyanophycinase